MAGAMAWGIRGQYGHERGAMIAGVLVGFVATLLYGQRLLSIQSARAVALCVLGISIGGCMTYGQTVGLTQDTPLVGNVDAYRWGMLGLAIKGAIWIGFGTAFLGLGLSKVSYRPIEMGWLILAMIVAMQVGVLLINQPYSPEEKLLPAVYFSDHWYWEADVDAPRREKWGGLMLALGLLVSYVGITKRDGLAVKLALWGIVGGAVGFPLGQAVQATHAWYPEWLAEQPTYAVTKYFNWWNIMETTFGATFGAIVGFGVWLHRRGIQQKQEWHHSQECTVPVAAEWTFIAIYSCMIIAWNFSGDLLTDDLDVYMEQVLPMILIPAIMVLGGRLWPFVMALPMVVIPIAGKTLEMLGYRVAEPHLTPTASWIVYGIIPVSLALGIAIYCSDKKRAYVAGRNSSSYLLVVGAWIFFWSNFAFFDWPWPWQPWGGRTPNAVIFMICLGGLTWASWFYRTGNDTI